MPQTQFSNYERYVITHMHNAGFSNAQIARQLGRHRATIGRELRRNRDVFKVYHYIPAQRLAERRRSSASQRYKLDAPTSGLGRYVRRKLREHWSPQQIAGRLERESRRRGADPAMRISHETIYRFIYRRYQQHGERWYERLRQRHKRRRSRSVGQRPVRGQIPGRVGIEQRPACTRPASTEQSSKKVPRLPHPDRGPQRLTRCCASELNPPFRNPSHSFAFCRIPSR